MSSFSHRAMPERVFSQYFEFSQICAEAYLLFGHHLVLPVELQAALRKSRAYHARPRCAPLGLYWVAAFFCGP